MSPPVGFFLLLGTLFGLVAAVCAFVITYGEHKHRFPDRLRPMWMALQTAMVTLLVFVIASLLLPWALASLGSGQ